MHIRDQHAQNQTKKRLKRKFATRAARAPQIATPVAPETDTAALSEESPEPGSPEDLEFDQQTPNARYNFRAMAQRHIASATSDMTNREPAREPTVIGQRIKLKDLFNFMDTHWVGLYESVARRNFDEELELYELIDLDGEGEAEIDIDLDESTGEMLFS